MNLVKIRRATSDKTPPKPTIVAEIRADAERWFEAGRTDESKKIRQLVRRIEDDVDTAIYDPGDSILAVDLLEELATQGRSGGDRRSAG